LYMREPGDGCARSRCAVIDHAGNASE
jgi:hypothetical protein